MTPLFRCLTQRQKKSASQDRKKYKRYIALKFYYLLYIFSWVFAGERSMKSRVFHFFFHHQLMMFTSIMALLLKLRISFLFFLELYPQSGDEYIRSQVVDVIEKRESKRRYNKKGFNTRAKNHCQRFKLAISPYLRRQFGYVTLFLSTPGTFAFDEMRIDNFRFLNFNLARN